MLTKKQKQIRDFIKIFTKKRGYSPSIPEIAKHFKRAVGTIHEHIKKLQEGGYLRREENKRRGIEISKAEKLVQVPLLGTIAAGQPIEMFAETKETIAIPKNKIPVAGEVYALRVVGDSMIDESINDGDVVLVKQQGTAENGQRVVALLDGVETTLKKFYKERGHIRLQPANKNIEPIIIKKDRELTIQGVVLGVIESGHMYTGAPPKEVETGEKVKKYAKLPINKIICGDALKELKKIPDKSIDLILTDPPYGLNKSGVRNDYDLSVFYASLPDSYRVLKDNSFYITFFSTKFLPKIFANNPFDYFWSFVLYCPNGRVGSPIGYTKYMSCIVFKKGNPKMTRRNKDIFVDTPGRMVEPDEGFIDHPTPKPKTFTAELLKMFSKEGDIALDPFIGSGSTAVACKATGRNYIGIEIDRKFCQLAKKRLKNFRRNRSLF